MPKVLDPTTERARMLRQQMLDWYDRHARVLPWRAPAGTSPNPYHVWLSEIMLQQTTVATVQSYFLAFIDRWPTVCDLADADLDAVLHAWAGLGYYARARNLHRCAQTIVSRHHGQFPENEQELRQLPGVGQYTAAAIAAIAFGKPATVVDGNVERVVSRLFAVETPLPDGKPELYRLASGLFPDEACGRPGDMAQAMMDVGATICTPKRPKCMLCPWCEGCAARHRGLEVVLPAKRPKPAKPVRRGLAYWTLNGKGHLLLRRRPDKGLLGGMMEIPSSDWVVSDDFPSAPAGVPKDLPAAGRWSTLPGLVRHTFTHFHLELKVAVGRVPYAPTVNGRWVALDALGDEALPTVMRKVVRHALTQAGLKAGT